MIWGGYLRSAGWLPLGVNMTHTFPSERVSTISRADQVAIRGFTLPRLTFDLGGVMARRNLASYSDWTNKTEALPTRFAVSGDVIRGRAKWDVRR